MRIITCNINGIRSAYKKGFFEWAAEQHADFICLQEIRQPKNYPDSLDSTEINYFNKNNYYLYSHTAEKPGYSGVCIYAKQKPLSVQTKLSFSCADTEGRFIQLSYLNYHIVSVYFPSGTSGDHRQVEKYNFMEKFEVLLKNIIRLEQSFIICGDINIAHQIIDLKNWRANQKNSGFLPKEREWLDKLILWGWIDVFREKNSFPDQYTWWSNRANAYQNNVGWRIDYQWATPDWKNKIQSVSIYKDQRFSDHAPLIVDYI